MDVWRKKHIILLTFLIFLGILVCFVLIKNNKNENMIQEKNQGNINYDLNTVVNQYKQDVYLSFLDYIIEDVYGDADTITYDTFREKQEYNVYVQEEANILTFYFLYGNKNKIMCDEMEYDSKRNIYTTFLKTSSYNPEEEISEIFEGKDIHLIYTFNMELDNNYKLDAFNQNSNGLFNQISKQINSYFLKNCEKGDYEIYIRYFSELDEYTYAAAYDSENELLYYLQLTFKDDIQNPGISFPMAYFEPEKVTENKVIDAYKQGAVNTTLISTKTPEQEKDKTALANRNIEMIYGKWKILDMVGEGYIYGNVSMKDYVEGEITICEDYIECDLPLGKEKLENPKYKLTKQNKDDFWEYRHANADNGFGFRGNKIKMIEVYDGKDEWDGFGSRFWVRDKKHLIFLGPVYFLAEKVE